MSFHRRALIALAAAAALASPLAGWAQDIKPRLIRFGYGLNEQSNQGRASKVFAEAVDKASGGKMKVRAIGASALGPDVQMQQALIGGAQEMMVGSTATLVGITKEMALWDTPFLFNDAKEADAILDGPIGQKVIAKLEEKGLVGLVYWENGFRNLTNNKRAVTKLEDLDGIKLRVMQNEVYLNSFKTLGANAIPMPFSELFSALETKTVDGQEVVGRAEQGRAEGAAGGREAEPRLRAQGHARGGRQGAGRPQGQGHADQRAAGRRGGAHARQAGRHQHRHRGPRGPGPVEGNPGGAGQGAGGAVSGAAGRCGGVRRGSAPPGPRSFKRAQTGPAAPAGLPASRWQWPSCGSGAATRQPRW
jgi:tripartite ATP-independent transporter DctP family solute receptor